VHLKNGLAKDLPWKRHQCGAEANDMNTATSMSLDLTKVVTRVSDAREARLLPSGIIVGDTCGGRSFTDNVAAVLEARSHNGWCEVVVGETRWTLIVLAQ